MTTDASAQDREAPEDDPISLAIKFNEQQDLDVTLVRDVQRLLRVAPAGWWDEATVRAVIRFQEARGLDGDGNVGPDMLRRLGELSPDREPPFLRDFDGLAPRSAPSLDERLDAAIAAAEQDWNAGTSEADLSPKGLLAAIFRDSGWSILGVDRGPDDKAKDWCGMAVVSWLKRAGLDRDHRATFWATSNVHSCFTYSRRGSAHRTMKQVKVNGAWRLIEAWHAEQGSVRLWYDFDAVRTTDLAQLDVRPGDVALINHLGKTDGAHHITMVRRWDGKVLETIEGNATGLGPAGERRREAVVINQRDLADPAQRKKIFGIGRLSAQDFVDLVCK